MHDELEGGSFVRIGVGGGARARGCSLDPQAASKPLREVSCLRENAANVDSCLLLEPEHRRGTVCGTGAKNSGTRTREDGTEESGRKRLRVFNARCSNSRAEGVFFDRTCSLHTCGPFALQI